jgi:hypothetical protein
MPGAQLQGGRSRLRSQAGQGQCGWVTASLQTAQSGRAGLAQVDEVETEGLRTAAGQTAHTFSKQDRGASLVAALEMEMGNGDLKNALEHGPVRPQGFMPELL